MWCLSPLRPTPTENEIDALHTQGVYYSVVNQRWHGFYLNYGPHALLVRKNAVFVQGHQVLAQHTAPQVVGRFGWDSASESWIDQAANDGFVKFIANYAPLDSSLPTLCGASSLAVERALELLAGPPGQSTKWHDVSELESLKVGRQESLKCITVSQEDNAAREGVTFRRHRARLAQAAITLPNTNLEWPPSVADLSKGFELSWDSKIPHCNVVATTEGGLPATLLYLGENPEENTIRNVYAKVENALIRHKMDLLLAQGTTDLNLARRATDRLCIVYRHNHRLRVFRAADYADSTSAWIIHDGLKTVNGSA